MVVKKESVVEEKINEISQHLKNKGKRISINDFPDFKIQCDNLVDDTYGHSCDINYIVSQISSAEQLSFNKEAFYGDVSDFVRHETYYDKETGEYVETGEFDEHIYPNLIADAIERRRASNKQDISLKKQDVEEEIKTDIDKDTAYGSINTDTSE